MWLSYMISGMRLLVLCVALAAPPAANAAVFNVMSGDVQGLINAINMANANGEDDTINLEAGTYLLQLPFTTEANTPVGLPPITSSITINGAGAAATIIRRESTAPSFTILLIPFFGLPPNDILTLNGLTVTGGSAARSGGGILNFETLNVNNCVISDNMANDGGGISNGSILNVTSSIIRGNSALVGGGGVDTGGTGSTATITNSIISGNTVINGVGGGVSQLGGTTTLADSTVSGNSASSFGGGIDKREGDMTVSDSTISGNSTNGTGAGILNNLGSMTVRDSTISENTLNVGAAGIANFIATLTITNSTISGNTTGTGIDVDNSPSSTNTGNTVTINNVTIVNNGFGLLNRGGDSTVNVSNTIVARNGPPGGCQGTFNSRGFNLIRIGQGCNGFVNGMNGDQVGTPRNPINVMLSPLQDNGGPTLTHALLPGSPAIDAGNPAAPGSHANACETTDQRGASRPQGGACDIGAFESSGVAPSLPFVVGTAAADAIMGTPIRNIIMGLRGNDTIGGAGGNDAIRGGRGLDSLNGNRGNDRLFGQRGNDRLFGGRGNDVLNGGPGFDVCDGGRGNDTAAGCERILSAP